MLVLVVLVLLRPHVARFSYNGYSVNYPANLYKVTEVMEPRSQTYVGVIGYSSGLIKFELVDQQEVEIIYYLQSQELPPSNALNDIYPLDKNMDPEVQKRYSIQVQGQKGQEGFVLCTKSSFEKVILCMPAAEELKTNFNYGDIEKLGRYYFATTFSAFGFDYSRLQIRIRSDKLPDEGLLSKILELNDLIINTVPN